jgi:hypothetical protein
LFLLVLACTASLAASGRFSLRLFFDTAIALGPIVVIQLAAFALAYWTGSRPVRFAPAVDAYFDGSWPWFAALTTLGIFGAITGPIVAAQWFSRIGVVCAVAAIGTSVWIDVAYFSRRLDRSIPRAVGDVIVQRAVGWTATILYFLLTAVPKAGSLLPAVAANVFGARP